MVRVTFVEPDGARREVRAAVGASVMEAALYNDVAGIVAECGGACSCATCHVYVAPEWLPHLPSPGTDEAGMLELARDVRPASRLSCQIALSPALDGLAVEVADNSHD
jgi:2Fe-2S ferredoxin